MLYRSRRLLPRHRTALKRGPAPLRRSPPVAAVGDIPCRHVHNRRQATFHPPALCLPPHLSRPPSLLDDLFPRPLLTTQSYYTPTMRFTTVTAALTALAAFVTPAAAAAIQRRVVFTPKVCPLHVNSRQEAHDVTLRSSIRTPVLSGARARYAPAMTWTSNRPLMSFHHRPTP